jgi:hypothetical protein
MPERHPIFRHRIAGGWGPDFGPTAEVEVADLIRIPWLVNADNLRFTLDGGVRKVGGTERLNAVALESGAKVTGIFDYWRHGTGGSPTQKRVIHVGTKIQKDDADGNFTDIFTGMVADAIPSYAIFDDYLILMNDAAADVPRYWDQSTAKVLGTNTPNGSFGATHKNRFWIAGVHANPSRLYYSEALPAGADGDWNAGGAGVIDVDPGDGDRITGLISFKNDLWVFKGPYKGSIHRITGSSPSDFARTIFVRGLGAVWHNGIFPYSDDIGFVWSDGSVHSLRATSAFGDFNEAALSLPLNEWLRDHVRQDRLGFSWAVSIQSLGCVFFTVSIDTATTNNALLCMDYRFVPSEGAPRWSLLPAFALASLANVVDESAAERPALFGGGNDGFVRRMNRSQRSLDGITSYSARTTYPFLHYGGPVRMKTLGNMAIGLAPRGNYDITVGWTRDDEAQQTATVSQAGGDVLAPAPANQFTLDTSVLGGASFVDRFINLESAGEFRSIQFEFSQGGNFEDMEVHSLTAEIEHFGALSWEN